MRKLALLFLLSVFTTSFVGAQTTAIPDSNFEQALIDLGYDTGVPDGTVPTANINTITNLNVSNKNISDLTGVEDFSALIILSCATNQLTTLGLSNNIALTTLSCGSNQLTTLDVSNNTGLTYIDCYYNQITTLDVSNNTALTYLNCGVNQITSLDVSNNTALTNLRCISNQLTTLDVSNNTSIYYLFCSSNQLTTLDVSNNTSLTSLSCSSNQLTTLDVTNNTTLISLSCSSNQLTTLDVSNNTLTLLYCSGNPLITLDVTGNTALTDLNCSGNQLTTLDISNNTSLTSLACSSNQLTSLDVSNHTMLTKLYCNDNQLNTLNVKNGNNINQTRLKTQNNPNLFCILVDDPWYSLINWLPSSDFQKDVWTHYNNSGNCGTNKITGIAYFDENQNCVQDNLERGLSSIVIKAIGSTDLYSNTNDTGYYELWVDSNTSYQTNPISFTNANLFNAYCPIGGYTFNSGIGGATTPDIDFGLDYTPCPLLTTDISSSRRRRCFENQTSVRYCNEGFADATNVKVYVEFPEYVNLVSANKTYTIDTDGNYVFDIGNLAQGDCGTIHIIDSVACINGITGLTQCTKAWITPANTCADSLDPNYGPWDKSSMKVLDGECIGDTIVRLVIWNHGSGDMTSASEYRIYSDNQLVYTGSFQLVSGDSLVLEIPANGTTIRLEADQHPLHPGNSHPRTTLKGCGNGGLPLTFGLLNASQMDDEDVDVEIHCLEIRDSYDPNDKSVSPEGITANRYVKPGTQLDYVIRFQNTGSDTAYTVVVVDTLSADLDLSTIQWGVSSHPYTIDVNGQGRAVVTFTFNNINLPDSTTDEAGSQGFVKFKINPNTSIANGTVIQNEVDIYFDFNLPIRTNDAWVTIFDTTIIGTPITVTEVTAGIEKHQITTLKIVPNPFTQELSISLPNSNSMINPMVNLYNLLGKKMRVNYEMSSGTIKINGAHLTSGVYFIEIRDQNKIIGRAKVIKK